jgi:GntR family transcriptional regulator, arabinose operon transcriptional repressor
VLNDNRQGTCEAVDHLVSLGHTDIGFISSEIQGTTSIEDRLQATEEALLEHDLLLDPRHVLTDIPVDKAKQIYTHGRVHAECKEYVMNFLRKRPSISAVIASNDYIGLTVLEAAHELGINVPDELSLLFFRDYELSNYAKVPPTCMRQQETRIGNEAAELLLSVLDNPHQPYKQILVPMELTVRESTARSYKTTQRLKHSTK